MNKFLWHAECLLINIGVVGFGLIFVLIITSSLGEALTQ